MEFKHILFVAVGGGLGSALRVLLGQMNRGSFPFSTLVVNVLGSFLIGLLFNLLGEDNERSGLRFFLLAGFCGGFTTFSTFSLDVLKLLRDGNLGLALANVLLSFSCCIVAVFVGWKLSAAS